MTYRLGMFRQSLFLLVILAACRVRVASSQAATALGGGHFVPVVGPREQVSIAITRQHNGRVAEPLLNHLDRQAEPAVDRPIDAPRRIEMPQGMHARILRHKDRLAISSDLTGMAADFRRIIAGWSPRFTMLAINSTLPAPFGKTRLNLPAGKRPSIREGVHTSGGIGTVRSLVSDFGRPMSLNRSARCRTWISRLSRSTSCQRSPRNSEARSPVKIAVNRTGRQRPARRPQWP